MKGTEMVTLEGTDHKVREGCWGGVQKDSKPCPPPRESRGAHNGLGQRDRDQFNLLGQGGGSLSWDGGPLSSNYSREGPPSRNDSRPICPAGGKPVSTQPHPGEFARQP